MLLTMLDEWMISRGWKKPPKAETFPLMWCEPINRSDCGMYACCLYGCWDVD